MTPLLTDFSTILPVWKNQLWPERFEPVESRSALLFQTGFDENYKTAEVFFVKIETEGRIIGVCSGQKTGAHEFRARGLYVAENFRKKGVGSKLFRFVEAEAKKRGARSLWTLARHSSKGFYLSMRMKPCGKTREFEYGPHFYMSKNL